MRLAGVCAAVVAAVLLVPLDAGAAPSPEFDVVPFSTTLSRLAVTELDFWFPVTAAAPARIVLTLPHGYGVQLSLPGTTVAIADANVQVGGTSKHVDGNLVADDPARYATNTCSPGAHSAVWNLSLTIEGQSYVIPWFVDGADDRGYTMSACLLSPDLPTSAGGAPAGARITFFDLFFNATFRNPDSPDYHLWSAIVTPFAGGTATPDPAAAYELRSIVPLPEQLTVKARYDKKRKDFVISGNLITVGQPEADARIDIYGMASSGEVKTVGSTKTNRQGAYTLRKKFSTRTLLMAYVPIGAGDCDSAVPSPAPSGCILESWSPVFSALAVAAPPKKR